MDKFRAFRKAVEAAKRSPCQKSKRGAVVWCDEGPSSLWVSACNGPPPGFACDGSDVCRSACNKLCLHAEERALLNEGDTSGTYSSDYDLPYTDLLHIKVVDGEPVPSGPPSCWQCSRKILQAGIKRVWLMHEKDNVRVLKSYTVDEFHEQTLINCGLPVIRVK